MSKKIKFIITYLFFLILFFELILRLLFSIVLKDYNIIKNPQNIIYKYYPEVKELSKQDILVNDNVNSILLLGASVLEPTFGSIEVELKNKLKSENINAKIYNVSTPAHTSLDSRIKLSLLKDKHFDIIIFYHGINETRFNNCSDKFFKHDYSHIEFYKLIKPLLRSISNITIIPYSINLLKVKFIKYISPESLMNQGKIVYNEKNKIYGEHIKTEQSFSENLKEIIKLSKAINAKLVLPTFSFYLTDDYNLNDFKAKRLDYAFNTSACPVELWGYKENVKNSIVRHNKIIYDLYRQDSLDICFFDMNKYIPKNGENFNDICHLTKIGSEIFVELLYPSIQSCFLNKKKRK